MLGQLQKAINSTPELKSLSQSVIETIQASAQERKIFLPLFLTSVSSASGAVYYERGWFAVEVLDREDF